jgi:2-iminobutanoate/2-iminopropanoate deaminase
VSRLFSHNQWIHQTGSEILIHSVNAQGAPEALGPYSHGVIAGGLVFTSGQVGIDPNTGLLVEGGIVAETGRALRNIASVLESAGSSIDRVVKTTVYLLDLSEFSAFNHVYGDFFGDHRPARATVQVGALPAGARVEIEAIASVVRTTDRHLP